jgi:hypothetical protein
MHISLPVTPSSAEDMSILLLLDLKGLSIARGSCSFDSQFLLIAAFASGCLAIAFSTAR